MRPEKYFLYDNNHFTLKELLGMPEILNYFRRDSLKNNRENLRNRLYVGLHKGNITKEVVMGYMEKHPPELRKPLTYNYENSMRRGKYYPYGDNHFTLDELLEKPEILSYLRRYSLENSRKNLRHRLYAGLRKGNITKEVVMEYMEKYPPELRKPLTHDQGATDGRGISIYNYGKRRTKPRRLKKEYVPISPSEVMEVKEKNREFKDLILES